MAKDFFQLFQRIQNQSKILRFLYDSTGTGTHMQKEVIEYSKK